MTCRKPFCWCRLECQQRTSFIDIVYYSIIVFFFFSFFFLFDNERTYIYIIALRLRETSSLSRLLFRVLPSLCVYRAFFDNQTNERSIRNRRQQKKRRRNEKTEPLASMNAPVKDALQLLLLLLFCLLLLTQTLIPAGFFSFFLFFFFFYFCLPRFQGFLKENTVI